jgi:hypothetical protein
MPICSLEIEICIYSVIFFGEYGLGGVVLPVRPRWVKSCGEIFALGKENSSLDLLVGRYSFRTLTAEMPSQKGLFL